MTRTGNHPFLMCSCGSLHVAWSCCHREFSTCSAYHFSNWGASPTNRLIENMERFGFDFIHLYGLTESFGPTSLRLLNELEEKLNTEEKAKLLARQGVRHSTASSQSVSTRLEFDAARRSSLHRWRWERPSTRGSSELSVRQSRSKRAPCTISAAQHAHLARSRGG